MQGRFINSIYSKSGNNKKRIRDRLIESINILIESIKKFYKHIIITE